MKRLLHTQIAKGEGFYFEGVRYWNSQPYQNGYGAKVLMVTRTDNNQVHALIEDSLVTPDMKAFSENGPVDLTRVEQRRDDGELKLGSMAAVHVKKAVPAF